MSYDARAAGKLDRRIRAAEGNLFAAIGADVDELWIELEHTGGHVRVLSHGRGPALVLLHGVSLSAPCGHRCSANFIISGCSRWTSRGTGCRIVLPSAAGMCASSPVG